MITIQSITGGGGSAGAVVLASGTVSGLTNAAPQTINLNSLGIAAGTYSEIRIVGTDLASSAGIGTGANLTVRLAVNGTAGATAYGTMLTTTADGSGSAYTDTEVLLIDYSGTAQITDGGFVIRCYNMFDNKTPWGEFTGWHKYAAAGTMAGRQGTFIRAVQAVHDGFTFFIPIADADTQSFNYKIVGIV